MLIYVDASVIGGCEDEEFRLPSLRLWEQFVAGAHRAAISSLTIRELIGAPDRVRARLDEIPAPHQVGVLETGTASLLSETYLHRGMVGPGSRADALHVAMATVAKVDVLVSWNFKHIVNLGRIRLFNAVNADLGHGMLEIRTPLEVVGHEEDV